MSRPLKVLILEDSADDAEFLLRELRHGEYNPDYQLVDSPRAMRDALKNSDWDIILSDYYMPGFSALTALQILHDLQISVPFIVITGATGEDIAVEAMRAGAQDYLLKHNLRRLVSVVQRELKIANSKKQNNHQCDKIKQQSELYCNILDSVSAQVMVFNSKGKILHFNKDCELLSGYNAEEIIGTYIWDNLIPNPQIENVKSDVANISNHNSQSFQQTWKTKDGDVISINWQYRLIGDADSEFEYVVATGNVVN